MCCRQLIVAEAVGSVDVLQVASTSALKSVQNVNSMHVVVGRTAERVKLITLSVHVCYRDGVQVVEWDEQKIKQLGGWCGLRMYVTADSAGTYRCVASNVAGRAECQAQVTVGVGKLVE